MRFNDYKTQRKFAIIFSLVLGIQLLSFLPLFPFINQLNTNSYLVDVAGRNRTFSTNLALFAILSLSDEAEISNNAKQEILRILNIYENSLTVLRQGGTPPATTYEVVLPKADPILAAKVNQVKDLLAEQKKIILVIVEQPKYLEQRDPSLPEEVQGVVVLNPAVSEANQSLQKQFSEGKLLKLNYEVVDIVIKESEHARIRFYLYLGGLFLFNALSLFLIYQLLVRFVQRPLTQIAKVAERISAGSLTEHINYLSQDELGKITGSINLLVDNLQKSASFINEISQGNFEAKYEVQVSESMEGEANLTTSLLALRDRLRTLAEEDKQRQWINDGLTKFGELLRTSTEIRALCQQLITELVRYLHMEQGGIYLINEEKPDDPFVELIACIAYDRQKYLEQRFAVHEGLIGRAIYEKAPVYLTEIPTGYAKIGSGLGYEAPRSLLILPLNNGKKVIGAIELASLAPQLADHYVAFATRIAEVAAVTISNVMVNQQTEALLQKFQKMAEELRANEEEMRQNLEELQATQEEVSRRNVELDGFTKAINSTLATIEFDMSGKIQRANAKFLSLMGYEADEITGLHHRKFIDAEYARSEEFKKFWEDLNKGIPQTGSYKRFTKSGGVVWLNATYTPINDKNGVPLKVIKLALDHTANKQLLDATQRQTEELLAQKEQLRQNMEKLLATQEVITKKQNEVEAIAHKFTQILEGCADSVIMIDEKGIISFFNQTAERMWGYSREEAIGRNVAMLMSQVEAGRHDTHLHNYTITQQAKVIGKGRNEVATRKDGTTFPIFLTISEAKMATGSIFTAFIKAT